MPTLTEAVDGLYRAFAAPKPRHIDGCPCCVDRKGVGTLLAKKLRDITPNELTHYAASAFLTVGDTADYLYFLPRILELNLTDPHWWPSPAATGRALQEANPPAWTVRQREAVEGCLTVGIEAALADADAGRFDEWLCCIGRTGFDVRPHLDRIAEYPAVVLAYFDINAPTLPGNRLRNAYWLSSSPAHAAVLAWFYSPPIAKVPFDAYGYVLTREGDAR